MVVINHRSALNTPVTSPYLYCIGASDALLEAFEHIQEHYKPKKLFCVGFSLGANILGKYQGEEGNKSLLDAAVCINGPLDMIKGSQHLESFLFGALSRIKTKDIQREIRSRLSEVMFVFEKHEIDVDLILNRIKTVWEIDEHLIAKMFKFKGADDFYRKCGCQQFIKHIKVPTMFIQALDDPIVGPRTLSEEEVLSNENIVLIETKAGGHLSFFTSAFTKDQWVKEPVFDFFNNI